MNKYWAEFMEAALRLTLNESCDVLIQKAMSFKIEGRIDKCLWNASDDLEIEDALSI